MLGRYSRELKLLDLPTLIHKMTSQAADRFGLTGRGSLAIGSYADLVVFDYATVLDTATYESPLTTPIGIQNVFVNGGEVVRDGALTDSRAGLVVGAL
jgi:N-acyl-D-aspartate/D-glutamate deacylase